MYGYGYVYCTDYKFACRYTPAIEATNEKLQAYARVHTRVDFVDCGKHFLEDDDKARTFPDS